MGIKLPELLNVWPNEGVRLQMLMSVYDSITTEKLPESWP